uniref:uncharacterized protein LOC122594177 n=1 Tax=Erigeron canadensis TaxID=72917 RepID=UPI001CB97030|nr:uncharacterized protein LOC122594177 [Erigeron canadensis]
METEIEAVTNLVTALENASFMAKHLLTSTTTTQDSAIIHASLEAAHRHLSVFLLAHNPQPHTSADDDDDDSPMQLEQDEDSKMITIEKVEEGIKDCYIHNNKNKRLKRSLSPASLAAGELSQRLEPELQSEFGNYGYDPHVEKLRALDLIYQFHS